MVKAFHFQVRHGSTAAVFDRSVQHTLDQEADLNQEEQDPARLFLAILKLKHALQRLDD